jgi:hypothetical protein
MKTNGQEPLKGRLQRMLWWLLPVVLAWGVLALLAHQTTPWTISWTQNLFGWTILLSYVCVWGAVIALSHNSRLMLLRVIAFNLTVGGIVLCLEIAAALKLVHWRLLFEKAAGEGSQYIWAYRTDPDLGFARQPDAQWTGRPPSDIERGWSMPASLSEPLAFTYDQWGYRNRVQLDDADVVLIGDSYIEGAYVSDDQTVASSLETRLGRPVANLGVAGYGSLQELIVLRRDAPRYKPEVVVWFFFEGNDLYEDHGYENALLAERPAADAPVDRAEGFAGKERWTKRSFTAALLGRLRLWSTPLVPARAPYFGYVPVAGGHKEMVYFADYASVPWSDWLVSRWNTTTSTLQEARALAEQRGVHLVVCFIPVKFRVYDPFLEYATDGAMGSWTHWPLEELFSEFCESAGLVCLDLTGPLQDAVRGGGMPYAAVDTHWSSEGNDIVATLLAEEFCRREWFGECEVGTGGELVSIESKKTLE